MVLAAVVGKESEYSNALHSTSAMRDNTSLSKRDPVAGPNAVTSMEMADVGLVKQDRSPSGYTRFP